MEGGRKGAKQGKRKGEREKMKGGGSVVVWSEYRTWHTTNRLT